MTTVTPVDRGDQHQPTDGEGPDEVMSGGGIASVAGWLRERGPAALGLALSVYPDGLGDVSG